MARPRTLEADTLLGFNCSYILKAGAQRSAEILGENLSTWLRRLIEENSRRVLGEPQWLSLVSASDPRVRRERLTSYLADQNTTRIKDSLEHGINKALLLAELKYYANSFEQDRDRYGSDLVLRVALIEAIELLWKIRLLLGKKDIAKHTSVILDLMRSLAQPLQQDISAAVYAILEGQADNSPAA
jgi:hypothetical protein